MARNFQRPENALRRAEEFMDVDKPSRALDTLYDFIKSKRLRSSNYSEKVLEPIMMKYLTLCVELKRSHIAKEGLYQYRNICQTVNIASLEKVVREYLAMAEKRTESAREASQQAVIDIDDLDNVASPESLLLSAVSGEDVQDRTDRAILTPWVRFLWESYRQCLELLRINPRLERLYHDIAQMAFKFCLKYGRKTEFRKLCDSLRTHLSAIVKQQAAGTGQIHLTNVETLAMNSETRLAQLESAIQMELWQEAYKAIEDINGLMVLSKKMPRPQMLANYYQKLALVFWKGGNMLFHAATLFRLFHLSRDMKKNISATELSKMAGQVVMATLGVALPSLHPEFDRFIETEKSSIEKTQRLANLLNLPSPPTRQGLVRDLVRLGVLPYAPAALQRLYHVLETDFNPLTMCKEVGTIVGDIAGNDDWKHLAQYCEPVQNMALVHLMKQVAQVYQTIDFERLLKLASFTTAFHLQRIIVDLVRHNDMQIRIDHMKHSVHFGVGFAERAESEMKEGGVTIQPMPSDQIRFQLMDMARALEEAYQMIEPDKIRQERQDLKKAIHRTYHSFKERDHRRMLMRQQIIEDRKELMETLSQQRAEEERRAQEEVLERHRRAEEERLAREMREREERRKLTEMEAIKERQREERVKMLTQTAVGAKVLASLNEKDLESIDADLLMQRQVEELEKERQELQSKMKNQLKKVDHFERAKRLEEVPLLKKAYEDRRAQDKEFWEKEELERIELAKKEREYGLATRQRLERIQDDYHEFMSKLRAERDAQYDEKMNEFQAMLDAERNVRLEKRKQERKEQRRVEYEEEMKRKAEEEEKKKLEQVREKARKEREEMDRLTKERMKREEEVEQKRKTELEEQMRAAPRADDRRGGAAAPSREKDWRRGPETGGDKNDSTCGAPKVGWRDRVKLKEEEWGPSKRGDERSRDEPTARDGPRSWRTEPRDEPSSRGVNRDERRGPREDRPTIRDEGFRRGPPRDDSDRDADVRRGPPREEREEPRREERGPPAAEDRAPAVGGAGKYVPPINRRGGAGPRDDADRDRDTRDRPGPGPRDFGDRDRDRDMPPRRGADEGPWRRGGDRMDGPSPRDRDRDMGPRGGDGPRGGGGGGGGPWRRGGDDRGPPRGGDDRGPRGPPRGGDDWGRRAGDDRDKEEPRKDGPWRPRPRGDDGPRRAD